VAPHVDGPPSDLPEPTIVAPSRRTPPPIPQTGKPATIPPTAQPAIPAPVAKQVAVPAPKKPVQKVTIPKRPSGPSLLTRVIQIQAAVGRAAQRTVRSLQSALPKGKARTVAAIAAGVVVVAIAATAYFLTRGPVPTGTLVVEAAPWATVTGIRKENGREQPV